MYDLVQGSKNNEPDMQQTLLSELLRDIYVEREASFPGTTAGEGKAHLVCGVGSWDSDHAPMPIWRPCCQAADGKNEV